MVMAFLISMSSLLMFSMEQEQQDPKNLQPAVPCPSYGREVRKSSRNLQRPQLQRGQMGFDGAQMGFGRVQMGFDGAQILV
jgi:hypothetical protein